MDANHLNGQALSFDPAEAKARQEEIYRHADGEIWRRAVYEPLHDGWELACIGGRGFLDHLPRVVSLSGESRVLELGCGTGAACAYLAERTGTFALGVERNAAQLARAKARAARYPTLAFLAGDAACWQPEFSGFDAVLLLDTLSLVPEGDSVLATARRALAPDGRLFIADLCAGDDPDPAVLARAYQVDGFVGLRTTARLRQALTAAGFGRCEWRDATRDAVHAFATILEALGRLRGSGSEIPDRAVEQWQDLTAFYLDAFRQRKLLYTWWTAAP